jgi:hypothetical protein
MLMLAVDENFNNNIIMRGLLRRNPDLNIVRIQDVGLSGADESRCETRDICQRVGSNHVYRHHRSTGDFEEGGAGR